MLHWYRLAHQTLGRHAPAGASDSGLVAHGGSSPTASLSQREREKLFWLGLIEAAPLFAGGVFSIYTDSSAQAMIAAIVAIVAIALTSITCWCLRHQVPLTRIEFSQTRHPEPRRRPN
jgi:hypothetical protein